MTYLQTKYKAIIIGPGSISRKYIQAANTINEMKVIGVVSRNLEKARKYADEMNIQYWGDNLRSVALNSNANVAIVCTPNAVHRKIVLEASELGLHILCEKPLATTREAQNEIIETCRKANVKLGVSYLYRFLPHIQKLKQLIGNGSFGDILTIDARMSIWRDSTYYSESTWHGTENLDGGGSFIQQGSHLIDLTNYLSGGYRKIESANRFTLFHPISVEDHGYAIIKYMCGAVGMIECSTIKKNMNIQEIQIMGTKGSARVSFEKILEWSMLDTAPPEINSNSIKKEFLFQNLLRDFCDAITQNRDPFISGDSAKKTGELIFDIYETAGQSKVRKTERV